MKKIKLNDTQTEVTAKASEGFDGIEMTFIETELPSRKYELKLTKITGCYSGNEKFFDDGRLCIAFILDSPSSEDDFEQIGRLFDKIGFMIADEIEWLKW